MKKITNPLKLGDVIQTNPQQGFWGCAVVLSARDSNGQFHPMCHIGVTTFISKQKYKWSTVDQNQLEIVRFAPVVRVAPNEYYQSPTPRTCIGIYSLKSASQLTILGNINTTFLYDKPLTFDVGDGTSGNFPLCGPIKAGFGSEAVVAWRKIHDEENFAREVVEHREQFERYEQQRLAAQREKRPARGE
jgi:hypothetical protein